MRYFHILNFFSPRKIREKKEKKKRIHNQKIIQKNGEKRKKISPQLNTNVFFPPQQIRSFSFPRLPPPPSFNSRMRPKDINLMGKRVSMLKFVRNVDGKGAHVSYSALMHIFCLQESLGRPRAEKKILCFSLSKIFIYPEM